jgi:hypothetical protein
MNDQLDLTSSEHTSELLSDPEEKQSTKRALSQRNVPQQQIPIL